MTQRANPSGLPHGCGSMHLRGGVWWLVYRDSEGRTIQENAHTDNEHVARHALVLHALDALRAKVAMLEGILKEEREKVRKQNGRRRATA